MKKLLSFLLCITIFFATQFKHKPMIILTSSNNYNILIPNSYKDTVLFPNTFLVLANTNHHFDNNYIPSNLDVVTSYDIDYIKRPNEQITLKKEALIALEQMITAMRQDGLNVYVFSGYRSYVKQISIYESTTNKNEVALPGFSEHQSALAVDLSTLHDGLSQYFSDTLEYHWLYENSYKYGFILRYPKDKEYITGYSFEPWHYRYVGIDALKIRNEITLEEYIYYYLT